MKTTVTHACSHVRTVEVKGKREAAQYKKWLAAQKCPDCRGK